MKISVEIDKRLEVGGKLLAFDRIKGEAPGIIFLGGYASRRSGEKAQALFDWCKKSGRGFVRFDYSGHGDSEGVFTDGTIGRKLIEATAILDQLTSGPQVIIGSSMGGWVALLLARKRSDRVGGIVTIACATDFTERVIRPSLDRDGLTALETDGVCHTPPDASGRSIPIMARFLEEAKDHLLLASPIEVTCPVHLIHGLADDEIPWQTSLDVAQMLTGSGVALELVKNGDHRLSSPADIERMLCRVGELIEKSKLA